jgi:LysM domain
METRLRAVAEPPGAPLSSPEMAPRSPARFLAPLALVAFSFALFMVVTSSSTDSESTAPNRATEARPDATRNGDGDDGERRERKGPRRYTVQPGDTPSSIADETGVPLEEILRLNPDLDPQTLTPGQRIRLRQ